MMCSGTCHLSTIFKLIRQKNWAKVQRSMFLCKLMKKMPQRATKSKSQASCFILHYACQFRPPQNVVKSIFKSFPDAACIHDGDGRYALHVACKYGCDPQVIKIIIDKNPDAVRQFDSKRRTPLHLVYMDYIFSCKLEWMKANKMLLEVAKMLTAVAPQVVTEEDYKGLSALEYGLIEELQFSSIILLQSTVERYHHEIIKETG